MRSPRWRAQSPLTFARNYDIRSPQDRQSREGHDDGGATPKPGAVRGTHVAPLGTLAFRVGRRVRISFAPAKSLLRTGGYVDPCRRDGLFAVAVDNCQSWRSTVAAVTDPA
jgi:hypothetical protein